MEWKKKLSDPLSLVVGVLAFMSGLLDPVIHFVASSADLWFPVLGGISQLGSLVPAIPSVVTRELLIFGVVVYVFVRLEQLADRAVAYYKEK